MRFHLLLNFIHFGQLMATTILAYLLPLSLAATIFLFMSSQVFGIHLFFLCLAQVIVSS